MFWMLTAGLSWSGGLSDGRFNIFCLPRNERDIAAHLEYGFRVDDRERSCIQAWADDGCAEPPGSGGISVWVFGASDAFASDIDKCDERYWAEVMSKPPIYRVDLHHRAQIFSEASRLAGDYSNSG